MDKAIEDIINSRPQRLCHMCAKCCRYVTTKKSYAQLQAAADSGEVEAIDFLKIFTPYESLSAALDADKGTVENIIYNLKQAGEYNADSLTFYHCKYIRDDNTCGIYEQRPDLCKRFPLTPWTVIPPGCGFEGWLFQKREEKMAQIRKQKENLISLEILLGETENPADAQKIQDTINNIKKTIETYAPYGAWNW